MRKSWKPGQEGRLSIGQSLLYRDLPGANVQNRSSAGTSRGYAGYPACHTVAKLWGTVSCQFNGVLPCGLTADHAAKAK